VYIVHIQHSLTHEFISTFFTEECIDYSEKSHLAIAIRWFKFNFNNNSIITKNI